MEEKKKNPKILMYGYFGAGNIGDEAILEVQAKILRELNPNIELSALVHSKERAKELNIKAYDFINLEEIHNAIEECDLIISGGGGLFQDSTGAFSPLYYGLIIYLSNLIKKPVFILGQGFGPITSELGILYTKTFLKCCTKATFRDEESVKEFHKFAPDIPAQCTTDPVFAYEVGNSERGEKLLIKFGVKDLKKKIIYFNIREYENLDYKIIVEGINKWYDSLEDKYIQIIVIPFQFCYDEKISKKVSDSLKCENYFTGEIKVSELMDLFAVQNCELIFSTRLHGIILGSVAHKCCLAISYDYKVEKISNVLKAPYVKLDGLTPDKICNILADTWKNRKEICEIEYELAMKEKAKVYDTVQMALDLLGNN